MFCTYFIDLLIWLISVCNLLSSEYYTRVLYFVICVIDELCVLCISSYKVLV